MSDSVQATERGDQVTIAVRGRFDFTQHRAFRAAYERLPQGAATSYTVDLAEAEYLDSAALGMLLLLREYAGGHRSRVSVQNCAPEVKEILKIASFDALFEFN